MTFRNDDTMLHTITVLVGIYENGARVMSDTITVENLPGGGVTETIDAPFGRYDGDAPQGDVWECRVDGIDIQ